MYKNELSDKQKEFAQEKADLQSVIDQQKKGGEEASNAELNKVKKDLEKAQKELQEGAVEKERFQAQLEMLVQELEQKQVILAISISNSKLFIFLSMNITNNTIKSDDTCNELKGIVSLKLILNHRSFKLPDADFQSFEHYLLKLLFPR